MRCVFLFLFFIALGSEVFCQKKSYKNELGFRSENDAYLATKQDRYYTNGVFIQFKSIAKSADSSNTKKIWSANFGQELYNAQSGQIREIANVDRPFAAYLYGGGSFQWLKSNENSLKVELQVGVVGPSALGEETQTLLHKTVGFYEISGWQFQVNDELGINTKVNLHYFLLRTKAKNLDLSVPVNLSLGNTFSGINAGLLFRTGDLNPFYHSVATESNIADKDEAGLSEREFYFFLKPSFAYVAYDATIEGGLFTKDKGPVVFDANPFVFSQQIGAAYANNRWTFDFSVIFKSKQLQEAKRSEQYGSVAIYHRF